MNIKDKVTIVIPCYNEDKYITRTIMSIAKQSNIYGTTVIIVDGFSTDKTREKIKALKNTFSNVIDIEIVDGGRVSFARNYGASLVSTKYTLFIDADTILIDNDLIDTTLKEMYHYHLHLLTCKLTSNDKNFLTKLSYFCYNVLNYFISWSTPFAIGKYFLTNTNKFKELGGFDEKVYRSEDYDLSNKYDVNHFRISKKYIGLDSEKLKKKGYLYTIKSLINKHLKNGQI